VGRHFPGCSPRRSCSEGAHLLPSVASLLPHPSTPPLPAKFDVAFLWRAEREGEVPVREQPPGHRQQGRGECWQSWQWLLFTGNPGQKLNGRNYFLQHGVSCLTPFSSRVFLGKLEGLFVLAWFEASIPSDSSEGLLPPG